MKNINIQKNSKFPVLVIGDTHEPYAKKGYLEFCKDVEKQYKCKDVIHIGDFIDNHALSYHEKVPELDSPLTELQKAIKKANLWYKAFPKVRVCLGNHDKLPERKLRTIGIPLKYLKAYSDVLEAPSGWIWTDSINENGVFYAHTLSSNYTMNTLLHQAVGKRSSSIVCGHAHTISGVSYHANEDRLIFAMAVGCGIDKKLKAFDYCDLNFNKPIVSCGVVFSKSEAIVIPMSL